MSERRVEPTALKVLWSTLRHHLAPELSSPLAKDRAKRADAALLRLVAGFELLPQLRAKYADQYAALLRQAQALAAGKGLTSTAAVASGTATAIVAPNTGEALTGSGNPVFVGIPGVAGDIEALLSSLASAGATDTTLAARVDQLILEVVRLERTCRADYETQVMALAAARASDAAPGRELNVASLQIYLRSHPKSSPTVTVRSVNEIPGGRSKRTVLVTLEQAGPLPPELVLRLDTGRNVGSSVVDEFPLLDRLARRGLPVPEPLWLESSPAAFGAPCIVFRRMPGAAAGDLIEGAHRKAPATGLALARALARVHAGGATLITDPVERASTVPHTRALLTQYFDFWRARKPFPSLVVETAFAWLFRRLNDTDGEATVVHADTGFHNMLLDDAGNGCLLDWEFAHLGDAAEDLASCRPAVEKCLPWVEFMAEYQTRGGLPVSDFRLKFFEIWRPLRNAVLCGNVLYAMMQGEADDMDPVTIGLSTFARLQADLAGSLANCLEQ
jgi:aminoglycoside phosphotransferase (APT) family kinase protein